VGIQTGAGVKRVLLTGMSGVGKSSVTRELAARGYKAVDADEGVWSEWAAVTHPSGIPGDSPVKPDQDWVWREDRIRTLLATEDADVLFVSGCAANMGQFLPQFDHIILLSAPAEVIVARLATRTTNDYGKHPAEVARVLALIGAIEPLLRAAADHEINTSAPMDQVVATVLALAT
jgi:dephospho-CoA kinase